MNKISCSLTESVLEVAGINAALKFLIDNIYSSL